MTYPQILSKKSLIFLNLLYYQLKGVLQNVWYMVLQLIQWKGVFSTQKNVHDGAFFAKIVNGIV